MVLASSDVPATPPAVSLPYAYVVWLYIYSCLPACPRAPRGAHWVLRQGSFFYMVS